MTTFDLLNQAAAIVAALDSPDGADPDAIDEGIAAFLGGADDKLGALWAVSRRLDVEDADLGALAKTIAAKRRRLTTHAEHIKHLATALLEAKEAIGEEPKVKRQEFTAWLQAAESVQVPEDATTIPTAYQRVTVAADKTAIKEAIKGGVAVPGCSIVTNRSIRWKS